MPAVDYLAIEKTIAIAHRTLWRAANEADRIGLRGVCEDLEQLLMELGRIQEDLLRSRSRR